MKKNLLIPALAIATCSSLQASTILIDYNDGDGSSSDALGAHDTEVANGAFTGLSDADFSPWISVGTGGPQFRTNNASPGSASVNFVASGNRAIARDTGHILTNNESFNVGFWWRDAANWDAGDTMELNLFYTDDNTISGTATDIVTLNSGGRASTGSWESEIAQNQTYTDATAVGKTLFVRLEANSGNSEFSRVDDIYVDVTQAPEPSSSILLGLSGLALITRRKR